MKYFLFVSFRIELDHNALYGSLSALRESLEQLVYEENLDIEFEEIPQVEDLKKHFSFHDDFYGGLSNGTWFHIQETRDENILKTFEKETVNIS